MDIVSGVRMKGGFSRYDMVKENATLGVLGLVFREARLRKGWTVPDAAKGSGCSEGSVWRIESGFCNSFKLIEKYARAVGFKLIVREEARDE